MNIAVEIDHARIFFPMYANFFQTTPDSLTSFKCGHLQKNIYIYKYIFRLNSRGLAPLGPARPDKFINLATLGPSALASRGIKTYTSTTNLLVGIGCFLQRPLQVVSLVVIISQLQTDALHAVWWPLIIFSLKAAQ